MALEAELQRRRAASGGATDRQVHCDLEDLEEAIAALREALTVLRTLSSPPGPPRIGYGFVLPPQWVSRRRQGSG